jgi:hypothetical protein
MESAGTGKPVTRIRKITFPAVHHAVPVRTERAGILLKNSVCGI